MNIFAVDESPIVAARQLPNKLIVKMPTETVQIVVNAFRKDQLREAPYTRGNTPYKQNRANNPATLWATATRENLIWLLTHGIAMCEEYTERYNKIHYASHLLNWAMKNVNSCKVALGDRTPFVQLMPPEYIGKDPVVAYRNYMKAVKAHYAIWPEGKKPHWWNTTT